MLNVFTLTRITTNINTTLIYILLTTILTNIHMIIPELLISIILAFTLMFIYALIHIKLCVLTYFREYIISTLSIISLYLVYNYLPDNEILLFTFSFFIFDTLLTVHVIKWYKLEKELMDDIIYPKKLHLSTKVFTGIIGCIIGLYLTNYNYITVYILITLLLLGIDTLTKLVLKHITNG